MKTKLTRLGAGLLLALFSVSMAIPVRAQNLSGIKQSARNAAAGVKVTVANGKATVAYKGKVVWSGKAKSRVTAKARTVDGKEYAAAFDGKKVLWENVKGAAKQVR